MTSERGKKPYPSSGLITIGLFLLFLMASFAASLVPSRFGGMERQEGASVAYGTASGNASQADRMPDRTVSSQ